MSYWNYEYTLKDHLGNARVNFRANGTTITHLEELHYYPFGMLMEGLGTSTPSNDYAYNGKELNEDFGLNLSDYGARWYDAALGRWGAVDPLAEQYASWSGYNYVMGNPVGLVDPDGMRVTDPLYYTSSQYLADMDQKAQEQQEQRNKERKEAEDNAAWPPEKGTKGDTHTDTDGSFVHDGNNWINQNDGSRVLPTVTISSSYPMDYSGLVMAATGAGIEGASYEMYNDKTWFSIYQWKSYGQHFNGNGSTGGKNAHGRYWSRGLTYLGRGIGGYQAYSILEQRRKHEINNIQFWAEQGANYFSTFGGLHGAAWGVGWETGRSITKTSWYHQNIFLKFFPEGRDGLLSTDR